MSYSVDGSFSASIAGIPLFSTFGSFLPLNSYEALFYLGDKLSFPLNRFRLTLFMISAISDGDLLPDVVAVAPSGLK